MYCFTFVSKAQQALQEQQARARGIDLGSFDVSIYHYMYHSLHVIINQS